MRNSLTVAAAGAVLAACSFAHSAQRPPNTTGPSRDVAAEPRWIAVPKLREFNTKSGGLFVDILSRVSSSDWYGDYGTTAHEVTHQLNNKIANGVNWAYYIGDGRAAILSPPHLAMSDVAAAVHESIRGEMYAFYVLGLPENDPVPMVLLDEWSAYYNDLRVQMELIQYMPRDQRVSVAEQLAEFCVIGLAVFDAIELIDPGYHQAHPEFRVFVGWLLRQSLRTYDASRAFERFQWSEPYMTSRVRRYLDTRLAMLYSQRS